MKFRPNAMEAVGALMVLSLAVVAILAPWLAPYDPARAVANTFGDPAAPSRMYPLGTDQLGRDVLSRIIYGARISLTVGVAAMAVTMTIGVTIGLTAGFFGGAIDFALMRFTDVMLTLPALLLAMAFVAVLRPSILSILLVIGLVSWTQIARVVRAEALSMTQRDFVMAARALGAPSLRLIARHVMPNVMPIIVVMAVLGTSGTLLLDAGLSFLTLGVPPPTPSWGRMIEEATTYFRTAPWLAIFPASRSFTPSSASTSSATASSAAAAPPKPRDALATSASHRYDTFVSNPRITDLNGRKMPLTKVPVRDVELPQIIRSVEQFLGADGLKRKLSYLDSAMNGAAPIYRENFLRPRASPWFGLRSAIERSSNSTRLDLRLADDELVRALHMAFLIFHALDSLPTWKGNEIKSRLLDKAGGDVPALVELTCWHNLRQHGAEVQWVPEKANSGRRVPDLSGNIAGVAFEYECKAKSVDTGRRIALSHFYQFADRLVTRLPELAQPGPNVYTCLEISTEANFPRDLPSQEQLITVIRKLVKDGGGRLDAVSTAGDVTLSLVGGEAAATIRASAVRPFELRIIGKQLIIRAACKKPDKLLRAVEEDLKDALKQFSGTVPALIGCYIPEIESFRGAEKRSTNIFNLVEKIGRRYDANHLASIAFFSGPRVERNSGESVDTDVEALSFGILKFRDTPLAQLIR